MARNAANKDVLAIYVGKTLKFFASNGRRIAAQVRVFNPSFDTDLQVKLQAAPNGNNEKQRIVLAGTSLTGQFSIKWGGKESDPITYSSTGGTLLTNVVAGLLSLSTKLGYAVQQFRAAQSSTGANGATIDIVFAGSDASGTGLGKGARDLVTVSLTPTGGTALTGGSPTAVITRTTAGAAPGSSTYSDVTPDGQSAATATVKPRANKVLSYGTDSDSDNLVGPYIAIVGVAGQGEIQADWDETHVQQQVN